MNAALIDQLNRKHASDATQVTRDQAVEHLRRSGDMFIELVRSLRPDDLQLQDDMVRRLVEVAIRHPDGHRSEIEAALAAHPC